MIVYDRLKNRLKRIAMRWMAGIRPPRRGLVLEKIGSEYGGWFLPVGLIKDSWICYSGGIGEDTTFDQALIERFSCHVYAFDPTPRAQAHAQKIAHRERRFHYYKLGLWSSEETLKFFAPKNPNHVSHSIVNLQGTTDYFEAQCKRVSTIMNELQHERLDLLKIDIEGAEYEVLNSIIDDKLSIRVLCAEFDQPTPFWKTYRMIKALRRHGFFPVCADGWNYTFVADI